MEFLPLLPKTLDIATPHNLESTWKDDNLQQTQCLSSTASKTTTTTTAATNHHHHHHVNKNCKKNRRSAAATCRNLRRKQIRLVEKERKFKIIQSQIQLFPFEKQHQRQPMTLMKKSKKTNFVSLTKSKVTPVSYSSFIDSMNKYSYSILLTFVYFLD